MFKRSLFINANGNGLMGLVSLTMLVVKKQANRNKLFLFCKVGRYEFTVLSLSLWEVSIHTKRLSELLPCIERCVSWRFHGTDLCSDGTGVARRV